MKEIYYDELTGAHSRKFLYYWVDNEIKRANRFATKFALILLDLDNFRDINNTYGHLEGDKVLIESTKFLKGIIREVDSLVRYGGDEFIILVPNTDIKGTLELAQRIITNLNNQQIIKHKILCSIGFSIFPDDGMTIEGLIGKADNLMYQAKKEGKNQIGLKPEVTKKLQIPSPVTIGREDEANWCLGKLREYNTVFIAGEAGIGKTRLVFEIKNKLSKAVLIRGNSYAALSSVPYHPFKNLFRELVSSNFMMIQEIFRKISDVYRAEVMKFFPDESPLKTAPVDDMDKYRLFNGISTFLSKMAESTSPNTMLILIDDLHWIDRPSCELLDFLVRNSRENIKIFGTYRTEEIKSSQVNEFFGIWAREKIYTQIILSPLNEMQSFKLLESMMGSVPQVLAKYAYQQGGGNPFYMEEIMRELERQKKLYWNGREWVLSRKEEQIIPLSIEETIHRKLTIIDPAVKYFLEIAAVYGQEFSTDFIALVSKRNVGEVLDAIDELIRLGFIKERTQEVFFFSEDIVRQIVYKNTTRSDLVKLHKAVGEAIELFYHSALQNYYEQLADHFTIANDVNKALFYSKQAAAKAKNQYAHRLAIRFFENCLKLEDNIDEIFEIKQSIGEIAYYAGEYDQAIENLKTCLKINPNDYKIYEKLGKVLEDKGDYKESMKYYRQGLILAKGTPAFYAFGSAIAWIHTRFGQYLRGKKECEDILKEKRQVNKKDLGITFVTLGVIHQHLGEYTKARKYFHKGLMLRQSLGDKKGIAACYINLANNNEREFKIKESEDLYKKALELYEEIGYQQGIVIALLDLGVLHAPYNLLKAEEYYLKALSTAKLIGAKRDLAYLYNNLGSINFRRLMHDQALSNYKLALQYAKETNFDEGQIFTNLNLSEFYRETGQLSKGKSMLQLCQRIAKRINLKYHNWSCLMDEIEYLLLSGNLKKADYLTRKLAFQWKTETNFVYRVYAHIYRAKVLSALKKGSQAQRLYDKAWAMIKSLPHNEIAGEIFYLKGVAHKNVGNYKKALNMFLTANKILEAVGDLRYLDKIEKEIMLGVK